MRQRSGTPSRCPRWVVAFVISSALALSSKAAAQEPDGLAAALALESALTRVIEQAENSVVSIARIKISHSTEAIPEFDPGPRFQNEQPPPPTSPDYVPSEFGTGFIIAPPRNRNERLVLTCYHVVRGGPAVGQTARDVDYRILVRLPDRSGYDAQIVAADPRSDLAVLRVDFAAHGVKPSELKPFTLDYDGPFRKGQFVVALGNPYAIARDGSASASWGMISNLSRSPAEVGSPYDFESRRKPTLHHFGTLLQVDTRLNLGTSGGPLLNLRGELIGITTSLAALQGYESSVGYAVPLDDATRRIIEALTQGQEVEYGFLGITPLDYEPKPAPDDVRRLRHSAAIASDVVPNSPAANAGMQPGDLILSVNDDPVRNRHDVMRLIGQLGPEATARLRIWRADATQPLTFVARLGKWPVSDEDGMIATSPRYGEWRGLVVDYSTGRLRFFSESPRVHPAVAVLQSPAAERLESGSLHPGDFITHVNGSAVRTPAEFHAAVRGLDGDVTLRLIDKRQVVVRK